MAGSTCDVGIVVVGAQKSFSTTLAKALGQHPQIEMAPGEFHGFLDEPYAAGSPARLCNLFEDDSAPVKAFKCASYLADPQVPQRLYDDLGAPHIVACLRNPIERAQSAWYWLIRTGLLPVIGADEGLRWLLEHEGPPHGCTSFEWRHAWEVLEWGLYDRQLQTYAECFEPDKLHLVTDLEFSPDPDAAMTALISALGLQPFTPTAQQHRSNEGVYSPTRLRWLSTRQRFVWQRGDDGVWTQERPHVWWKWLANAVVVGTDRFVFSHVLSNEAPALSSHTCQLLLEYYAEDVHRLESRLGQDLEAWLA